MKNNDFLKNLHIGKIIKEIAIQKGVSSKKIAELILRYQQNANRIYQLDDMDIEDVVLISYLLEYNILDFVVQKYLSHLPFPNYYIGAVSRLMKLDMENKQVVIYDPFKNYDFLKSVHIGQQIKEVAEKNNWNEQDLAKQLQCAQSMVSYLYQSKSLKIKTLIRISDVLQYHFIAKIYLSQMVIVSSLHITDGCIIMLNPLQVHLKNLNGETLTIIFQQNDVKKQKGFRTKIDIKSYKN